MITPHKIDFFDLSLKNILNEVNEEEKEEIYKLGVEIKLEDFLNYLFAIKYLMEKSEGLIIDEILKYEELEGLILTIKRSLFKLCDIDKIKLGYKYIKRESIR